MILMGCMVMVIIGVFVFNLMLMILNVFILNGDDVNDEFKVFFLGIVI